jgi:hypothetical protein
MKDTRMLLRQSHSRANTISRLPRVPKRAFYDLLRTAGFGQAVPGEGEKNEVLGTKVMMRARGEVMVMGTTETART